MDDKLPKLTLSEILLRTEEGDTFYTETKDTIVGAYASRAGVKVKTERMLAIHAGKRELLDLTRVTVIGRTDKGSLTKKTKTIEKTVHAVRVRRSKPA